MSRSLWTPTEIARARDLYESGKTDCEIAIILGRGKSSVSSARQKFVIFRPLRKYVRCRPWLPKEMERAREFYARGASRDEMCATFERSRIAIKRLVTSQMLERDPCFVPDPAQFNSPAEEWRRSALAPRYAVSSLGRVVSLNPGKIGVIMAPWVDPDGYCHVTLQVGRRSKRFAVHRLVACAFISAPPSPTHHAAHQDGKPSHNGAGNLRWSTPTENQADRRKHGTAERRVDGRFLKAERSDARSSRVVC